MYLRIYLQEIQRSKKLPVNTEAWVMVLCSVPLRARRKHGRKNMLLRLLKICLYILMFSSNKNANMFPQNVIAIYSICYHTDF